MKTEIISSDGFEQGATAVSKAVSWLRRGETVALPTETVYGLAADAINPIAVAKIFVAKERPRFDPLIVHLPDRDWLEKVAALGARERELILKLADRFWPGPFTIVLPRKSIVPEIVTAGLDTVAVRISAHPVFAQILAEFGSPLAAPSANRFGHISPTTAHHVFDELNGRVPLIVDGGPTQYGIESTIVAVHGRRIDILRRGPITEDQLAKFGAKIDIVPSAGKISAPGQFPTHYAPKTPLELIGCAKSFSPGTNQRIGLLAWYPVAAETDFAVVHRLSESGDLREAATNLFRYLRELDRSDVDLIVAEQVPEEGLGAAINDRLRRAAGRG